jgi:predicted RNA-binding protein with EMAP domain
MTYDSPKDARLRVAQFACHLLKHITHRKIGVKLALSKEELVKQVASAESAVMTLLYLYVEPGELRASEAMAELNETTRSLSRVLEPALAGAHVTPMVRAQLAWCLRTLAGLGERLANPGTSLATGVDLVTVKVRNLTRNGKLWNTVVTDGAANYTVVTNLSGISPGDVLAVAFLPPREVGGITSEAMYLGGEKRPEPPGTILGEDRVDAREAAGVLHDEITRH